jgi:uncharacterized protein (DUF1778 family)
MKVPERVMTTTARINFRIDPEEKALASKAAALMGMTLAEFVRWAALEKAQGVLDRETRITLTDHDFAAFAHALTAAFSPKPALTSALTQVRSQVRRG